MAATTTASPNAKKPVAAMVSSLASAKTKAVGGDPAGSMQPVTRARCASILLGWVEADVKFHPREAPPAKVTGIAQTAAKVCTGCGGGKCDCSWLKATTCNKLVGDGTCCFKCFSGLVSTRDEDTINTNGFSNLMAMGSITDKENIVWWQI